MAIRILVNGAQGKMGQQTVSAVKADKELELVAELGKQDNLLEAIKNSQAEVVVDFTTASAAYENAKQIIEVGVHPVIGTSGFLPEQIKEIVTACHEKKLGGIIAPNFSIGAVLMMKFSKDTAHYFKDVEIIELHHDGKEDSPSGTAIKTSEMITAGRGKIPEKKVGTETLKGARGATNHGISIHSVRLPGLVAHQEVIFGGIGETLTIRHDSINRECFMPGVLLACKKVVGLDKLVYGLEHIL